MIKLFKIFLCFILFLSIQSSTFFINPAENAVEHNNYGLFYLKLHDYPAAIQEFKIAIALSPNAASTASFYNNLGQAYLQIHYYNWAVSCFNMAISKSPNFLEYYSNLVKAYKGKKLLGRLAKRYTRHVQRDKSDYIGWLMLGLIYKEQNKKKEALDCFKEFKKQGPDELLEAAVDNIVQNMQQ